MMRTPLVPSIRTLLMVFGLLASGLAGRVLHGQPGGTFLDRAPQLQQLVRQVASELEQAYRHDTDEYTRRYAQLGQAIRAWNESERSDTDLEIMHGWLRAVLRASQAQSSRPLPPLPQFTTSATGELPPPVAKPGIARQSRPPQPPTEPAATDDAPQQPSPGPTHSAEGADELPTENRPNQRDQAEPAGTGSQLPAWAARSSARGHRRSLRERRGEGLPPIYHGVIETPPHLVERAADKASEAVHPSAADDSPGPNTAQRANRPERTAATQPSPAERESPLPANSESDQFANQSPRQPAGATAESPRASGEPPSNPFADDPLPSRSAPVARRSQPVPREHVAMRPAPSAQPAVNVAELRARLVGYERGLRHVEAELMSRDALSAANLTDLTHTLNELLEQHEFVQLYLGAMNRTERRGLPSLRSAEPAVEMLSARITEQRHALRRRAIGRDNDDRRRDLLMLQEASRRLTDIGDARQSN